jgi:hypothetical protein
MENKQTAVEWLVSELNQKIDFIPMNKWDMIRDIVQQSKQIEKDQIKQAWIDGMRSVSIAPFEDEFYKYEAELYYDKMRELG